ncbi:hypothetical protein EV361DRAFT_683988 [Lentinula raphanica]|nr:hypothetical protein EV361DRAFT_683988 [Lentinula raphanica]
MMRLRPDYPCICLSTRIKNQKCPNCTYATADPGSLTRHRKRRHEYVPVFRRSRAERPATMPVPLETPGPEIIIVNPNDLYVEGRTTKRNPLIASRATKTSKTSKDTCNSPRATSVSALDIAISKSMSPPKETTPRPPSIAALLDTPNPEPKRIRPSNLAALLNPVLEPRASLRDERGETWCYAEQQTKMQQRFSPFYEFGRFTR